MTIRRSGLNSYQSIWKDLVPSETRRKKIEYLCVELYQLCLLSKLRRGIIETTI